MRQLIRFCGVVIVGCIAVFVATLTLGFLKQVWAGSVTDPRRPHVGVVDLSGTILSSTTFVKQLEDLLEDKGIKAIVVRINSPGGLVGPSQEIYQAILRADQKVPTLAAMGTLGASGGYYAALGARKIYANPGTLTASIGVIMEFANTERLFNWAKVERFALKSGKFKDVGSPMRAMTPEEKEFLTRLIQDIYGEFRATVKERRKLTEAELDTSTDGRIMSGTQAVKAKLVDQIGGFHEALKEAKTLGGLPEDAKVVYSSHKRGVLRELLLGDDDPESSESTWLEVLKQQFAGAQGKWRVLLQAPL